MTQADDLSLKLTWQHLSSLNIKISLQKIKTQQQPTFSLLN